jgi:hypothetical protein
MCKKCKLNVSVNDNTYPSPNKATQQNKITINNKINSKKMQENKSKNLATENVSTNNDVSNDTTNVSCNNITMKTLNQKENTKEQLAVMALIAITEPATESQSSRAHKQPLRSHPSNKIKVLLDSGSNGDLYFLPKGIDKPFPYLTRQAPNSWHTSNGSFQTKGRGKLRLNFFSILLAGSTPYNLTLLNVIKII